MLRVVLSLAMVAVFLAHAAPAGAQNKKAEFDKAWQAGIDQFNLGNYDQAAAEFERARSLDPKSPGPWRYLGRIYKIQEKWEECITATKTAIRLNPDSKNAPDVKADMEACRTALGRPAYAAQLDTDQGALTVITNVEGASVTVDGIRKGATPLDPFPLGKGTHHVKVERRGYFTQEREVEIIPTIVVDEVFELEVDPDAKPDDRPPDPGTGDDVKVGWITVAANVDGAVVLLDEKAPAYQEDGSIETTPGEHTLEVTAPGHEPWRRRIRVARGQRRTVTVTMKNSAEKRKQEKIAYISFGVAALAGLGGATFGFLENRTYEEARDMYELETIRPGMEMLDPSLPEAEAHTRAEYEEKRDQAKRYGLISNVSFGVAAVALGVSVYYFIAARDDAREGYPLPRADKSKPKKGRGVALIPVVAPGERGGVNAGVLFETELPW